jgi:ornithine carbamoyltransferase
MVQELARYGSIPVFNMLTGLHHPCQALADLLTIWEACGRLEGVRVAYVGDGTNVARSLANMGSLVGMEVVVASPVDYSLEEGYEPVAGASGSVSFTSDPRQAVAGAQVIYTDVWVSMGEEAQAQEKRNALAGYALDEALLDRADEDAFALHCLPAHVGEEISEGVLYGPRQRIWEQAENRRHAQKALLEGLVAP